MTEDLYYLHERTCDSANPHEAQDWYQRYAARLDGYAIAVEDYAAAVAAALAARGVTGVDYDTAAGIDMVWIELTVPALRAGGAGKSVQDATVCFTDELGWFYRPDGGVRIGGNPGPLCAYLTPVTATTTAEDITLEACEVADRIAALAAGAPWPATSWAQLTPIDAFADGYLERLIDTLERRVPVPA